MLGMGLTELSEGRGGVWVLPLCLFCRVGRGPGIGSTDSGRSWVFVLAWVWLRGFDACTALIHCLIRGGHGSRGVRHLSTGTKLDMPFGAALHGSNSHVDRRVRQGGEYCWHRRSSFAFQGATVVCIFERCSSPLLRALLSGSLKVLPSGFV